MTLKPEEIRAQFPDKKPVVFNYIQAREIVFELLDALEITTSERDKAIAETEKWNDADCDTCPLKSWESCDEICKRKTTMAKLLAELANGNIAKESDTMKKERLLIDIMGVLDDSTKLENIKILLEAAGISDIEVKTLPHYEDWLETLPKESMPGLSEACLEWMRCWGNGGGDYSSECCIKDSINDMKTDVPAKLAEAIYIGVAEYSKTTFEAAGLTMELINDCISEASANTCEKDDEDSEERPGDSQ